MRAAELIALLREFHQDRLATLIRHEAAARHITDYDVNNTYQYVIAREETHLRWIADAIRDLGGDVPGSLESTPAAGFTGRESEQALAAADASLIEESLVRWRTIVEGISNARHNSMLLVVLGEMLEHKRFFDQAAAGRNDLLGRHPAGAGQGRVLASRWVE